METLFLRPNYPKFEFSHLTICFLLMCSSFLGHRFLHNFIPLVPPQFSFNSVIIGKNDFITLWDGHEVPTGRFNMADVMEFITM